MLKAIGTRNLGTLEPIQFERASIVPASTATAMSMPAPAIMMMVFHGMRAIASFCGASLRSSAMTAKMMATRPTSTLPAMEEMASFAGIRTLSSGKMRTTTIIAIISVRVVFCGAVKASGFLNSTPLPMLRLLLKPKRTIVTRMIEKTTAKRKICISAPKVSIAVRSGLFS